jgi:hypothetical protein
VNTKKSLGETEDGNLTTKEKVVYSVWGTLIAGGFFLIGRKIVKSKRSNNEEDKSFADGTSASYAKGIKMALHNDGWWGADMVQLRNVLVQIPSQDAYLKVIKSYDKMNGGSMLADMGSELKTTELLEMNAIINAKPKKTGDNVDVSVKYGEWANRINAAINKTWGIFPDPDTDAIKAVFNEIPTQPDYLNVGSAYQNIIHNTMDGDLKDKLHSWDYTALTTIINSKPIS